jgi:hypothetical protein
MELVIFGLLVWGAIALIRAWIRSHEAEQERARAREAERARAAARERWLDSLKGIADDGRSRFAIALDDSLCSGDWATVRDMVDTLPAWPIRELVHRAMAQAESVRENIRLAYAAGVHPATCEQYHTGQLELETALWTILVQTAIVSQIPGMPAEWRRVRRNVRHGVDEDRRAVDRITELMADALAELQNAMVSRDRSAERRAGRSLDDAARSAAYLAQNRRRPR